MPGQYHSKEAGRQEIKACIRDNKAGIRQALAMRHHQKGSTTGFQGHVEWQEGIIANRTRGQ